ncbi:hypothetical protein H9N28_01625 [Rhodobacter capsulatus]|uniref:hypothetical protein n=1 Tax=Rhodobacter capsulatus TaxID=1061 RepID=UPI0006DD05DE|nr:hypothetical protein [Rhodobacter capsulatus]KQB13460.1 hypothetical protein AP073_04745 [Rhodobacter capsulatus]KQB13718.1 hypothetical protein AP071_04995 [Rhodobacter capsulatus]QNR63566.1 hypothetical protein H9N28_01625 [Rhodobacter capsulatus]
MNDEIESGVIVSVRRLYRDDAVARQLFDWVGSLQRDAVETTIDRLESKLEISRPAAVELAKKLEASGCGRFIVGRKGAQSRFEWFFSRVSLGRVAGGASDELEDRSNPVVQDADDEGPREAMTIAMAKTLLARALGVEPAQIEIVVRA